LLFLISINPKQFKSLLITLSDGSIFLNIAISNNQTNLDCLSAIVPILSITTRITIPFISFTEKIIPYKSFFCYKKFLKKYLENIFF